MPYGETNPKNIYIGLIFSIMVFMLGFMLLGHSIAVNPSAFDGVNVTSMNNSMNYMVAMQNDINNTASALKYASTQDVGVLGVIGAMLTAGWNSLKQMFSTITYATSFLTGITGLLSIPPFIPGLIISVITVMIVVWIILLIFRRAQ